MRIQTTIFIKICTTFFLALLLCFPKTGQGQTGIKCFSLEKIKKLHASTFLEINNALLNENWEIIANATQTPFAFGKDTLLYDNFSQWKSDLSMDRWFVSQYRTKGLASALTFQVSKNCYEAIESELQKNNSIAKITVEDSIQRLRIFKIRQGMDVVFASRKSHQPYQIIVCDYTQIDSLIKRQIADKEEYEKTLQTQQHLVQTALKQIDSLRNTENYETAIQVLQKTTNQHFIEREELIIEFQEMNDKMEVVKKELNTKNFNSNIKLANSAFEGENYVMAKRHLLQAQQIDPTSEIVLQKLREIEKIESMLLIRQDSIFNYVFYRKSASDTIAAHIFKELRKTFLSVDAGDIDFSYTLQTDILGENISSYQINTFSLRPVAKLSEEAWASFLDTLIIFNPIPPVKINYLYVNAATPFQNQSTWNSSLIKVSKGKKTKISPKYIPKTEKRTLESYFIRNADLSLSGKYTIEKKKITYQDSLYTTLAVKKVSTVGPEAMAYSLFPGLGSVLATQGKKGKGIMASSLLFYSIGGAGFILINHFQKNDKLDTKQAEYARYGAWGAIGIGGIVHFSGIFVALKQGINNLKKSRAIKAKLKEGPIYVQEFPQHIES